MTASSERTAKKTVRLGSAPDPRAKREIVYVTPVMQETIMRALEASASEFLIARDTLAVTDRDLAARRDVLLAVIDRLRQAVVENEPMRMPPRGLAAALTPPEPTG